MKAVTATEIKPVTPTAQVKQWDAFPEPKGWSMQWDGNGLVPPQTNKPSKP